MIQSLKWFALLLWKAFQLLKRNGPLILASSTAFFTTFALSPIIVILVGILSIYFSNDLIRSQLFEKISSTFGKESAAEIETIVSNMGALEGNWLITLGGFVFLIFVATTLMVVVKQAINLIWRIRRKGGKKFNNTLVERTKGLVIILIMGFLFLVSLLLDTTVSFLHDFVESILPSVHMEVLQFLNIIFSLIVVTAWFTILYKILPDAKVLWQVALAGGLVTAILFTAGKWVLGKLLVFSVAVNIFGASASFALVLLFIFYSSLILYYGAAFTYVFAETTGKNIHPGKHSKRFEWNFLSEEENPK